MTIRFIADGRRANALIEPKSQPITAGSVGIPVIFELGNEYDGLVVTAVFCSENATRDVLLDNNYTSIVVPWEVLEHSANALTIGIVGTDGNGDIVVPTIWANAGPVYPAAHVSGISPSDPTADIGSQIVAQARAAAQSAAQSAEEAQEAQGKAEEAAEHYPIIINKIQQEADRIARLIEQGGGGGADLSTLEVYIADFVTDPPTLTEGSLNTYHRILVS